MSLVLTRDPGQVPPNTADAGFYSGLAAQARETAAMALRTSAGEEESARQARVNAATWRGIAMQARQSGQEENATSAEERAVRAENMATEADAAAISAVARAHTAEREAQRFDELAGGDTVITFSHENASIGGESDKTNRFLTQMYARFSSRQVGQRRGKTLRMCSCPVRSGAVVCRSIDGRLRGPRSWRGACSAAAGSDASC